MLNDPLPRLDQNAEARERLLPFCRLKPGEVWDDPLSRHRVGCLDAADAGQIDLLLDGTKPRLSIQDPPYNFVAFDLRSTADFIDWSRRWVSILLARLDEPGAFYVWLGADQEKGFAPLPDFMLMMREFKGLHSRSFITLRNQRGYGTQKNWMSVRQELLYYVLGDPPFAPQYTDIPKILAGYYKKVGDQVKENLERSRSETIRAGNVWVDVQQIFYRMEENVSGCYAQKPLKAIERIVSASSREGDPVIDLFSHSGTTLLACERLGRRAFVADLDPLFAEITIRRLLHFRHTGRLGWQNGHAFQEDLHTSDGQLSFF